MKTLRAPLFAAALFTSVAGLGLSPAVAQAPPAPANAATTQAERHHHEMSRMLPGQLVDGRIAFLKTELKITPAQEVPWGQVAAAMRQNANALDQEIAATRQPHANMDAIQRLTVRSEFAKLRADNDARLLAALKPLYASLSPPQQQMANALIAAQHGGHRGWHHRA